MRYKPPLDALLSISGTRYPEHKMALTHDRTSCAFDDSSRWVRGIVDLLIIDGPDAYIVDYKTGSNKYPDPKQLKLMALMTYAHFPEVILIKAGLLFVAHNSFVTEEYHRSQLDKLWFEFTGPLSRLSLSYENSVWPANPTPLCGWCPVESCKFHRER
jgi:hypothetical protein